MTTKPTDFDHTDPDVLRCPYPFFEAMHQQCPVYPLPDGNTFMVSTHAELMEAARQPNLFSNHRPHLGEGDPEIDAITAEGFTEVPTLTTNDPPDHTRFRKLLNRSFTPRAVGQREDQITRIVDGIIDSWIDDGKCDWRSQFCDMLPSSVIAEVLGIDKQYIGDFHRWGHAISDIVSAWAPRERVLEARREFVEFQHFFAKEIEKRQEEPQDDLLTQMIEARVDGERPLDLLEMLDLVRVFIAGGNLTTTDLLSNSMYLLLNHPEQMAEVQADHSLIPNMLEEALRNESPVQWLPRIVENEGGTDLGGSHIPNGGRVLLMFGAANRDAQVFPEPEKFDIHRNTAGHAAFGFGDHFCIGAALGRAEARIAYERLFTRVKNIRCEIDPRDLEFSTHPLNRGVVHLPLLFDKA